MAAGTVTIPGYREIPYSYGGTCVISCRPCDLANEIGA